MGKSSRSRGRGKAREEEEHSLSPTRILRSSDLFCMTPENSETDLFLSNSEDADSDSLYSVSGTEESPIFGVPATGSGPTRGRPTTREDAGSPSPNTSPSPQGTPSSGNTPYSSPESIVRSTPPTRPANFASEPPEVPPNPTKTPEPSKAPEPPKTPELSKARSPPKTPEPPKIQRTRSLSPLSSDLSESPTSTEEDPFSPSPEEPGRTKNSRDYLLNRHHLGPRTARTQRRRFHDFLVVVRECGEERARRAVVGDASPLPPVRDWNAWKKRQVPQWRPEHPQRDVVEKGETEKRLRDYLADEGDEGPMLLMGLREPSETSGQSPGIIADTLVGVGGDGEGSGTSGGTDGVTGVGNSNATGGSGISGNGSDGDGGRGVHSSRGGLLSVFQRLLWLRTPSPSGFATNKISRRVRVERWMQKHGMFAVYLGVPVWFYLLISFMSAASLAGFSFSLYVAMEVLGN
ncbi:hypothetical protein TruAng_001943 [Truncatella angustata]|nr:hypothetical protein TruAng_001943 [Truncatella angustata]